MTKFFLTSGAAPGFIVRATNELQPILKPPNDPFVAIEFSPQLLPFMHHHTTQKAVLLGCLTAALSIAIGTVKAQTITKTFNAIPITPINTTTGQVYDHYDQFVLSPPFVNVASFGNLSAYHNLTLSAVTFNAVSSFNLTPGVYPITVFASKQDITGNTTFPLYQSATQVNEGAGAITVAADMFTVSGAGPGFINLANDLKNSNVSVWDFSFPAAGTGYLTNGSLTIMGIESGVPEPSTWVGAAIGAGVLLTSRKLHRHSSRGVLNSSL